MKKIYLLSALLALGGMKAQTDLRILDEMGTMLVDVNNNGTALHLGGYYDYATNTSTGAEEGVTNTNKLNNSGDIAGTLLFEATDGSILDQAAYRKGGTWNAIGYFPGDTPANGWFSNANAISDNSKYVTGQTSVGTSGSFPYIYNTENQTLTKLTADSELWIYGRGEGVNDQGYVSGFVDREDLFDTGTFWVPAYFDPSGNIHYIDFDNPEYGEAADINNAGQIVGYKGADAFIYDINTGVYKAFGSTSSIPFPVFTSISDDGLVIGFCGDVGSRDVIVYHEGLAAPILLKDYLTLKGIDIPTFDGKLGTGMGVSADGKFMCGFDNSVPPALSLGWILHLDELPQGPGCLEAPNGVFPAEEFFPACTESNETITTDAKTGQYSIVHLTAGKEYLFSSSVATDFITISNAEGTGVIKFGTGIVKYIANEDQTVRFYLNLADDCTYSDETRSKFVTCRTPVGCQWTVHVFNEGSMGDEVSWYLKNTATGEVLLSGGAYGMGYDDTQTTFSDGPLEFYIEAEGDFGDNTPFYTVSNGNQTVVDGGLSGGDSAIYEDLNCSLGVQQATRATLQFYPNPVKDILHLTSPSDIKTVNVYAIDGKLVKGNISVNSKKGDINLSALQAGTYVVTATFADGSIRSFKILKN